MSAQVFAANLEEGAITVTSKVRRPLCLLGLVVLFTIMLVAGGPLSVMMQENARLVAFNLGTAASVAPHAASRAASSTLGSSPPPPPVVFDPPPPPKALVLPPKCGDGKCEAPETIESCFADCPGVTTGETCGEEPHSDPQGNAVVDGRGHHVKSAGECCAACAAHAAKNTKRPCNSWVFCYMPHCWSADNGNTHLFGECWLKWQADPTHPLYGQRGAYDDTFRRKNADKHINGNYPPASDKASVEAMRPFGIVPGSRRNLTVPTHVPWTGGVMGAKVDLSKTWTTGADGSMRSSAGDLVVDYRPWESREQNLKRGVKPEQMKF